MPDSLALLCIYERSPRLVYAEREQITAICNMLL